MYNDIFVSDDKDDLLRAVTTLKSWKLRMSSFYSVGFSATLAIIEADLKSFDPLYATEDLQCFYASALSRFLNYAHSLTMTQCSMYGAAKELGIDSFIVDIRHLCSHSSALPNLDTLKACSVSCKKWLRYFYWDNLLSEAKDVTVNDLPTVAGTAAVEKELDSLLLHYDFVTHQLWRRKKVINDVEHELVMPSLFTYAVSAETVNLMMIRSQLLKDLAAILEKNRGKLSVVHLFCRLLVDKGQYLLADCVTTTTDDFLAVTVVHQNLFHMIASAGIVGEVLRKFLTTSIDLSVKEEIRHGAAFWANQVLKTWGAYQQIRATQLVETAREDLLNLNWESINTKSLDKNIERAFEALGLTRENSLLFGPIKKNPWNIKFSREFVKRQLKHTNLQNKDAHEKLVHFADPPLSAKAVKEFQDMLASYVDPLEVAMELENKKGRVEAPVDFEFKTVMDMDSEECEEGNADLGIWSYPDEVINWEKVPIGSHLRHVAVE